MKELIKKTFDLWVRTLWLKEIEKVKKKRDKAFEDYKRQQYVLQELCREYCQEYPDVAQERKGGEK